MHVLDLAETRATVRDSPGDASLVSPTCILQFAPTGNEAGWFDSGSLTEIVVKDGVRIPDGRKRLRQWPSGCGQVWRPGKTGIISRLCLNVLLVGGKRRRCAVLSWDSSSPFYRTSKSAQRSPGSYGMWCQLFVT